MIKRHGGTALVFGGVCVFFCVGACGNFFSDSDSSSDISSTKSVSYNGNGNTGGTVPTDNNAYATGATVTVLGNTGSLTRTGYVFSNWNVTTDGSGMEYAPGDTFTIDSTNIILYARWLASMSVTVSIPGDGSVSFSASTISVLKGQMLTVSVEETGYSSYEWYIDGIQISGETSSSVSIPTSGISVGRHELMLVVTDSTGVSSSGSCRFLVTI